MTAFVIVASIVTALGVAIWLGLLLWAAREDGREQRARDAQRRRN